MRLRDLLPVAALLSAALAAPLRSRAADTPAAGDTVLPRFTHALPNVPGMTLSAIEVDYPPGGGSHAHRHAPSAFIYAYVVEGHIRSQVDDQPPRVYGPGEGFFENPGAHHVISENASSSAPAKLLAIFVSKTGDTPLTVPDSGAPPE